MNQALTQSKSQNQLMELGETPEKIKKEVEALVETAIMQEPNLKGRLNAQIAWQYLKMPDDSFGWVDGWKGSMPIRMKMLSLLAHFRENAPIGYGHILFLGNKLYMTAKYAIEKLFSDENLQGYKVIFEPLSKEEKEGYLLVEKDMAIKVILTGTYNSHPIYWEGTGIADYEEMNRKDKNGKLMQMWATKKNAIATVKTRALMDLIKYNYKSRLPIAPDGQELEELKNSEENFLETNRLRNNCQTEYDRQLTLEEIKKDNVKNQNETAKTTAIKTIKNGINELIKKGKSESELQEFFGYEDLDDWLDSQDLFSLDAISNSISDFFSQMLESKKESTEPKVKSRGRGRPKKQVEEQVEEEAEEEIELDVLEPLVEEEFILEKKDDHEEVKTIPKAPNPEAKAEYEFVKKIILHPDLGKYEGLKELFEEAEKKFLFAGDFETLKDGLNRAVSEKNNSYLDNFLKTRQYYAC